MDMREGTVGVLCAQSNGGAEPQSEGWTGRCRYLQMDLRNVREKGGREERGKDRVRGMKPRKRKERGVKKRQGEEGTMEMTCQEHAFSQGVS